MTTYREIARTLDPLSILKAGEPCPLMADYFIRAWNVEVQTYLDPDSHLQGYDVADWLYALVGEKDGEFYLRKFSSLDGFFYERAARYISLDFTSLAENRLWIAEEAGLSMLNMQITGGRRRKDMDYTRVWQISNYIAGRACLVDDMRRSKRARKMVREFMRGQRLETWEEAMGSALDRPEAAEVD